MNVLRKYDIPFLGLKEGKHLFDFEIDREFFEYYDNPDTKSGELEVRLGLLKSPGLLEFDIHISGTVNVQCDRCLDRFDMPLDHKGKLYVKFGQEVEDVDENMIILKEGTHTLNLAQYFYEYIYLSLPYTKVHSDEGDCNREMLSMLSEHSFEEEEKENIDPRWKGLLELKNKTKN